MNYNILHIIISLLLIIGLLVDESISQSGLNPTLLRQDKIGFENYNASDGLSQNSCYAITQDNDGFLWLGTQDGLNRYDGNQFKVFRPTDIASDHILSNQISSLTYDYSKNIIWVGTASGICIYVPKENRLSLASEMFGFDHQLFKEPIRKVIIDNSEKLWVITGQKKLFSVNSGEKNVVEIKSDYQNEINFEEFAMYRNKVIVADNNRIFQVNETNGKPHLKLLLMDETIKDINNLITYNDRLWIGTISNGCYKIDSLFNQPKINNFNLLEDTGIGDFTVDKNNKLWIGTRGKGILVYHEKLNTVQKATYNPISSHSLSRNFILSSFLDKQGNVWVGMSGSGVDKYDPLRFQFHNIQNEPYKETSLKDQMIFSIFKTKASNYFVGTQNSGMLKWNLATDDFKSYDYFNQLGLSKNAIYDIAEVDNDLYLASWGGLIKFNQSNESFTLLESNQLPESQKLYVVHKLLNKNKLLVGSELGTSWYSIKNKKWESWITNNTTDKGWIARYVYQENENELWICTEGANVINVNLKNKGITHSKVLENVSKTARHLIKLSSFLWIATDNGIVKYHPKQDSIYEHIQFHKSKVSNVVYSIQVDSTGTIWAGTNFGLIKIKSNGHNLVTYGLENGLNFLEFNTASTLKNDNDYIFGGVGGLTIFSPYKLQENYYSPAPIVFEIAVNNDSIVYPNKDELLFNYNENYLTFYFTNNNFSSSKNNSFHYRLSGAGQEWVNNYNRHFTTFTGLQPGDYTFELMSFNGDGHQAQDTTKVNFVINPPWWKTIWFLGAIALLSICTIILFIKSQLNSVRKRSILKNKVFETKMMALRAQMNPHFIFNCLNSIDALILSNEKKEATKYLNKFAKLLRNVLDSSHQTTISFSNDLENLKLYVELEEMRNSNKFKSEYIIDEMLLTEDYKVPPMIIQPYVENAIIHGLKNRTDDAGILTIKIEIIEDYIQYSIIDNGVGRQYTNQLESYKHRKRSYGNQMTKNRVKYFNKEDKASVKIYDLQKDNSIAGTKVEVKLKIK